MWHIDRWQDAPTNWRPRGTGHPCYTCSCPSETPPTVDVPLADLTKRTCRTLCTTGGGAHNGLWGLHAWWPSCRRRITMVPSAGCRRGREHGKTGRMPLPNKIPNSSDFSPRRTKTLWVLPLIWSKLWRRTLGVVLLSFIYLFIFSLSWKISKPPGTPYIDHASTFIHKTTCSCKKEEEARVPNYCPPGTNVWGDLGQGSWRTLPHLHQQKWVLPHLWTVSWGERPSGGPSPPCCPLSR